MFTQKTSENITNNHLKCNSYLLPKCTENEINHPKTFVFSSETSKNIPKTPRDFICFYRLNRKYCTRVNTKIISYKK